LLEVNQPEYAPALHDIATPATGAAAAAAAAVVVAVAVAVAQRDGAPAHGANHILRPDRRGGIGAGGGGCGWRCSRVAGSAHSSGCRMGGRCCCGGGGGGGAVHIRPATQTTP
jgi:hypothetical protein